MRSAGWSATLGLGDHGVVRDRAAERSRYLTDGVNLYRYVGTIPGPIGPMVALEDCRSFDVTLWPVRELRARQLQPVTQA